MCQRTHVRPIEKCRDTGRHLVGSQGLLELSELPSRLLLVALSQWVALLGKGTLTPKGSVVVWRSSYHIRKVAAYKHGQQTKMNSKTQEVEGVCSPKNWNEPTTIRWTTGRLAVGLP